MAINNSMNDVTTHRPASPYAISKLDGEYLARMFYTDHGLRTTCLRYFNVYKPRQDPNSAYAAAILNELTKLEPQMNADTIIITLLIYFSRRPSPTSTHPDPGRHAQDRTPQAAA